jgi:hypothetical protein
MRLPHRHSLTKMEETAVKEKQQKWTAVPKCMRRVQLARLKTCKQQERASRLMESVLNNVKATAAAVRHDPRNVYRSSPFGNKTGVRAAPSVEL